MAIVPNGPAPYSPSGKVIDLIERHRTQGLPLPLTVEKVARLTNTPGLAPRVIKALVLLDLVDEDGQATQQFDALATAPTEADYKTRFAEILKVAYADVFQYVDPATATDEQIVGQFRTYTPRGQIGRMVALFTGLCEYAGFIKPGTGPVVTKQRATSVKAPKEKPSVGKAKQKPENERSERPRLDDAAMDAKARYLDLLIKQAEKKFDPALLDRIERVLGVAPSTASTPTAKGDESN